MPTTKQVELLEAILVMLYLEGIECGLEKEFEELYKRFSE